jgi:hypothetical protein
MGRVPCLSRQMFEMGGICVGVHKFRVRDMVVKIHL